MACGNVGSALALGLYDSVMVQTTVGASGLAPVSTPARLVNGLQATTTAVGLALAALSVLFLTPP